MLKWLGLLLVLISWVAGFYLTKTWPGTKAMSLSKHAASAKGATRLFVVTLLAGGTVSYLWLVTWFVPSIHLSTIFVTLLTLTFITQVVVALIPDTERWKRKTHLIAAYSMSVLYIPLSILIIHDNKVAKAARIIGIICLIYMVIAAIVFLTTKRARARYLFEQVLYVVAFQVIILSAAYLK